MKKFVVVVLVVLITASLFTGFNSYAAGSAFDSDVSSSTEENTYGSQGLSELGMDTAADVVEPVETEPVYPIEMTMEEIEAILGFGYRLPEKSEYSGTIITMLDKPSGERGCIALAYTSDEFDGTVYVTKAMKDEANEYDEADVWEELTDAGTETINGIKIDFLGYTKDQRLVAYWDWNGFHYVLNCAAAALNADIMSILPLFIETYYRYSVSEIFSDVEDDTYYADAVLWAVANGITSGTGEGTFSPKMTCTRAQIVTFLYCAAGKPEHHQTESPFTDVKPGKWYYDAVMWAYENEITGGIGNGLFGLNQGCTRAQAMTFLYKSLGSPEPETEENPFEDVAPGKYYYKAVLWAQENGVTSGTSPTTFGTGDTCTRAQIVTFLYKVYGGIA